MKKFDTGKLVITPELINKMIETGDTPPTFLMRHMAGEWGEISDADWQANNRAVKDGSRIFSVYHLKDGTKIWCITEAINDEGVRASTCLLLPEEY